MQRRRSNVGSIGVAGLFSEAVRFEPPTRKKRLEQIFTYTVAGARTEKSIMLQHRMSNVGSIVIAGFFVQGRDVSHYLEQIFACTANAQGIEYSIML